MAGAILNYWGDGSLYGDGDLYASIEGSTEYVVEYEQVCHRLSVRVAYASAASSSGVPELFRIYSMRPRLAPCRQVSFTHEAFVDRIINGERISARLSYAGGGEFIISHMQLIAKRKQHQPKG